MRKIAKAIAGAVSAAGTGITTAASDGTITAGEWWVILGGTLIAGAAVYHAPRS